VRLGWINRIRPAPDAFAVVMATGIIAVAASDHGYRRIALVLEVLATAVAVVLAAAFALSVLGALGRTHLARDPDVAVRRFTVVAACAVLAACWPARPMLRLWLGAVGLAAWLLLVPLAGLAAGSCPPGQLRDGARGAWLLPSVATQGLAATAADVAHDTRAWALVVIASVAWLIGLALYVAVGVLIGWRVLGAPRPELMTPDSLILMGALAIATLAGAHIVLAARALDPAAALVGWARAATWGGWLLASAWIPVLLYAQIWRVDRIAGSLRYERAWWAAVFPLGMYSAASSRAAAVLQLRSLVTVSLVFFWVALTLWTLVTAGSLRSWWAAHPAPRLGQARAGSGRGRPTS
jgi:tellurite resistance protein TehA-like permease